MDGPRTGLLLKPPPGFGPTARGPPSNDFSPTRVSVRAVSDEADAEGREFWEESGDSWPDEPEEFDPHSLGPGVPEVPEAPDPTSDDVELSGDLVKAFWAAVVFANVGLLGVSLGPMLVFFEGRTDAGVAAFLVGTLSLVFAYRRYRGYVDRDETREADTPGAGGDD